MRLAQAALASFALATLTLATLTLATGVPAAFAADPTVAFANPAERVRYDAMLEDYRCLKCQNQNLADSHASLAGDLRRQIHDRIVAGADDDEIDDYLVSRYGEFVRYRPKLERSTMILWLGPFALLAIGLATGFVMSRRDRARAARPPEDDPRLGEARRLLDE